MKKKSHNPKKTPTDASLLSDEVIRLLSAYSNVDKLRKKELIESNYAVSQVLGSVAFLYERIRNTLDYKGEHLLRRNAIERILKRQIWEKKTDDVGKLTETLIKELIWARYIKNDSFPKTKISEIGAVIQKYLKLFSIIDLKYEGKATEDYRNWFVGVLSSEIEEVIDPGIYLKESMNFEVFSWFKNRFIWEGHSLPAKDRDIQMFIAIHRSLNKSDKAWIRYRLLNAYLPQWEGFDYHNIDEASDEIFQLRDKIETQLNSSYQPKMYRFVQRQLPAFVILRDLLDQHPKNAEAIITDPERLEKEIQKICQVRYSKIGSRIRRGIIRSIIYIFLTKALLAMVMEVPYELYVKKAIDYLTLSINLLFPPLLMFVIGMTIKKPGEENTKRITQVIKSFVYKDDDVEKINFSLESKKLGSILSRVFLAFYIFIFFLIFSVIGFVLIELGFNVLSATIFFIFSSLVLLFAYRVRYTATELNVAGEREGLLSHLFSLITIPFINVGSLLSQGFQRFNFLLLIMDFLFEAPLKNVIRIFEEWNVFIKEKREEVIEIPN